MAALNKSLLSDTSRLINAYLNPKLQTILQEQIKKNPNITYRGRPMFVYMQVTLGIMQSQDWAYVKRFYGGKGTKPENIISFFEQIDNNAGMRARTLKALASPKDIKENKELLSDKQIAEINKIEKKARGNEKKLTESYQKTDILDVKKEGPVSGETTPLPAPPTPELVNTPGESGPSVISRSKSITSRLFNNNLIKNIVSKIQIAAKKFISRHPTLAASVFSGTVGIIAGFGLTGTANGAILGAGLGGAIPSIAGKGGLSILGGGKSLGGIASLGKTTASIGKAAKLAATGAKLATGPVGWASLLADKKIRDKAKRTVLMVVLVVVAIVLGIPLMTQISNNEKSTALLPGYEVDTNIEPTPTPTGVQIPGLTLKKTGPAAVANGEDIKDTVLVTYSGNADIAIIDKIPVEARFLREGTTGVFNPSDNDRIITWNLKDNIPSTDNEGSKSYSFDIVLQPTANDTYVVNTVTSQLIGAPPGGGGEPPNTNTCNGKYKFDNPMGKNYGDPLCSFTKDDLYTMLKQLDPKYADDWFFNIIPCESSYNPNAFYAFSPDSAGAWGLYQMGRGKNGEYDHGDVPWQNQTSNAINYNKLIHENFRYWACARYMWR